MDMSGNYSRCMNGVVKTETIFLKLVNKGCAVA